MECQACRDNLTAYLDGELSSGERHLVDQHLRQCAGCSSEFQSLSQSYWMVNKALEEIDVRPEMWQAIEATIRPRSASSSTGSWRDVFASWFLTSKHAMVAGSIGLVLVVASVLVFESRQRLDPSLEALRPQLHSMVKQMDTEEQKPHNFILSPTEDESKSNPFALRHISFERNPFREDPLTQDLWSDSGPTEANPAFKTYTPEARETK